MRWNSAIACESAGLVISFGDDNTKYKTMNNTTSKMAGTRYAIRTWREMVHLD